MKVLIVDDSDSRVSKITAAIYRFDNKAMIDIAPDYLRGRRYGRDNTYDLAIVDIHIPNATSQDPKKSNGINLAQSFATNRGFKRPGEIICITSYDEEFLETRNILKDSNIMLIKCEANDDGWTRFIEYSLYTAKRKRAVEVDIVFLVALEEEETAVTNISSTTWEANREKINGYIDYKLGSVTIGGRAIKIACIRANRMGMIESSIVSTLALQYLNPKIAIMCGICAGIEGKSKIGDLVIASEAWDWQSGKYSYQADQSFFSVAPDSIALIPTVLRNINNYKNEILGSDMLSIYNNMPLPSGKPEIHVSPTVSGSAVVADPEVITRIKTQHRLISGLDMEIYGFYSSIRAMPEQGISYFACKCVCDLGNAVKDDRYHSFASSFSAAFSLGLGLKLLNESECENME